MNTFLDLTFLDCGTWAYPVHLVLLFMGHAPSSPSRTLDLVYEHVQTLVVCIFFLSILLNGRPSVHMS